MKKIIKVIIGCIIFSMFYFPFEFAFLRGINTKMMIAVCGLAVIGLKSARKKELSSPKEILILFLGAGVVSLWGLVSVVYNRTPDTAYATYIISMAVWFSAAFAVCCLIKEIEGDINIKILTKYMAIVCVAQCILALLIDSFPGFKLLVNTYINQDQLLLEKVERLYGIGASLDTAGTRFSAALIFIAHTITKAQDEIKKSQSYLLLVAFFTIAVIGNFIARTTIVGVALGLLLMLGASILQNGSNRKYVLLKQFAIIFAIAAPICIFEYNTSPKFYKMMRFGFEGFFSLVEKGTWEVDSNDKLKTMVVFPDNNKTWIIGDGYFENPRGDINYVGNSTTLGYYMNTDIGYLRFIFYFGLLGLISFIFFFILNLIITQRLFEDDKVLPLLIFALGLIIWFKVATDVFLVFALLLSTGYLNDTNKDEESEVVAGTSLPVGTKNMK